MKVGQCHPTTTNQTRIDSQHHCYFTLQPRHHCHFTLKPQHHCHLVAYSWHCCNCRIAVTADRSNHYYDYQHKRNTGNTSLGATQQQSPQTQQLISQLSNVIQLLTTCLSGNVLTNNPHPQVSMTDNNSAEVLSKVSDNPPVNAPAVTSITDNPLTSTTDNPYTSTTEPLFSATQSPPVALPAVPS